MCRKVTGLDKEFTIQENSKPGDIRQSPIETSLFVDWSDTEFYIPFQLFDILIDTSQSVIFGNHNCKLLILSSTTAPKLRTDNLTKGYWFWNAILKYHCPKFSALEKKNSIKSRHDAMIA